MCDNFAGISLLNMNKKQVKLVLNTFNINLVATLLLGGESFSTVSIQRFNVRERSFVVTCLNLVLFEQRSLGSSRLTNQKRESLRVQNSTT